MSQGRTTQRGAVVARSRIASWGRRAGWGLGAAGVLTQIAYPLTAPSGDLRHGVTVISVVLLAAAATAQLWASRGARWAALYLLVTALVGFTAEAVGVASGFPFGEYSYSSTLGAQLLGVPLVIPLAWAMLTLPALVAASVLVPQRTELQRAGLQLRTRRGARLLRILVAAWALTSWDLFLDPMMTAESHWSFVHPTPGIPGLSGIPLTNYLGWFGVAVLVMALLSHIPEPQSGWLHGDTQPIALYLWTYGSSVLAQAAFFSRPAVALVGGIGMGVIAIPLAVRLYRSRNQPRREQQP